MCVYPVCSQKPTVRAPKPKPSAEDLEPSRRSLRIQRIQPNGEPMKPPQPQQPPVQVMYLQYSVQRLIVIDNKPTL